MKSLKHFTLVLALIALSCFLEACGSKPGPFVPPPPDVTLTNPVQREVTTYLDHTGAISPTESVEIRARVAGYLESINFEPRAKVKAGDLLFVIEPAPYRAKVQQAVGSVNSQKSTLRIRQIELDKYANLGAKEAISELKLEDTKANRDMAEAELEKSRANLETAKIDLEYTHVRSPINGRVSRNLVDVGNLVGVSGATVLANVVNDDSVYVYFNLTEAELLSLTRKSINGKGSSWSHAEETPVYMALADETGYPHVGKLDYTDIRVDPGTGTVQVRAIFPNPTGLLYPGMFARVRVPSETREAMLAPNLAIMSDQGGKYVLVCDDGNIARHRRVTLGQVVDDMRVIESGLTLEDKVIVSGLQKTRPGSKVNPTGGPQKKTMSTDDGLRPVRD
jgi:membrane fusion protein, multidrug efflux system